MMPWYHTLCCLMPVVCLMTLPAAAQEQQAQPSPQSLETTVIPLKYAAAKAAAQTAQRILPNVRLGVDERINAVVAAGAPEDLGRLTALLETLDRAEPAAPEAEPQLLAVPTSAPKGLARLVEAVLSRGSHAEYNEAARLLVVNGPPADVERVRKLLASFSEAARDQADSGGIQLAFYFIEGVLGEHPSQVDSDVQPPVAGTSQNEPTTADRTALDKLEKLLGISFDDQTLDKVLETLAKNAGVVLITRWNVLRANGIDQDQAVTLRFVYPVPIRVILEAVLNQAGDPSAPLGYQVKDGILIVSMQEDLDRDCYTRVYDVSDLVGASSEFGGHSHLLRRTQPEAPSPANGPAGLPVAGESGDKGGAPPMPVPSLLDIFTKDTAEDRAAQLVELISSAVTPDAWRDRGGSLGAMTYFAGTLTVTHTESAHREIAALLDRLHAQTARTRAAIARQSLPPELEPVAKALAEQGFHAPQLLAPIFVYTRSGEQFRAEGIAPQTGRALQIDVGGRATLEGAEQVSIELKAGLREAPPLVGVAGLPQRPPLFELLSSVTTRLGDHVVLATAPGATGAEQAVAVVVRVTKAP